MKVMIDTCVIIDLLQSREPFAEDARDIMLLIANRAIEGYITAKSVTDIYYITHRSTHDDKITRDILSKLFLLLEVTDTAAEDCKRAIPSPVSDYEDAVMIEAAIRIKADCIVTRNIHDYSMSPMPVYTSADFVKRYEE